MSRQRPLARLDPKLFYTFSPLMFIRSKVVARLICTFIIRCLNLEIFLTDCLLWSTLLCLRSLPERPLKPLNVPSS